MAKSKSYLIDTHILIWSFSAQLSPYVAKIIKNPDNHIFVSIVSIWEIIIKKSKGKLKTPKDIKTALEKTSVSILSLSLDHILKLDHLPHHHKDPFDRIIVAQAQAEKLTLITADKKMARYKIKIIKA